MTFVSLIFYFLVIVPSAIIHEYAHGAAAEALGDKTARYAGRLTLNPLAHIDLWGTIVMPIILTLISGGTFMFAYAKPVPYNPYNLKNQKWGPALVGIAGPLANLLLAVAMAVVIRIFPTLPVNQYLAIIVYANILLMVFNLIPIPPLDGSKILLAVLPYESARQAQAFFDRYGFIILMLFVFYLFDFIAPIISFLYRLLLGV